MVKADANQLPVRYDVNMALIESWNKQMRRVGLTILSLSILCFWLVGSYLRQTRSPEADSFVSFVLPLSDSITGWIAILCFVGFVVIQLWILHSTRASLADRPAQHSQLSSLQPGIGIETFWTFLPIVLTLLLAWGSWMLWHSN